MFREIVKDLPFDRGAKPDVCFAGMLQYDGDLKLPARFLVNPPEITNTLTEVLVAACLLYTSRCV